MPAEKKRLFFAFEVHAPWPTEYPKARLLDPSSRHLTCAFLGNVDDTLLQQMLPTIPPFPFQVGLVGVFDKCLFLHNKRRPNVVAWHAVWEKQQLIEEWQQQIVHWLKEGGYAIDEKPFLSHVTIGRSPLDMPAWEDAFSPIPVMLGDLCLLESVGNLTYNPIWRYPLQPPYIELSHTADIAFLIQAEAPEEIFLHAQNALASKAPSLLRYIKKKEPIITVDENVIALNRLVTQADSEEGCPLKAVSFHGEIQKQNGLYQWEMIVDV
jgi:2'-5' RNA ligase